jgi:hypothetical protein
MRVIEVEIGKDCIQIYLVVNLAHVDLLHTGVLGDFTQDTSITASNDQHLLGLWAGEQGEVSDHFLVGVLVSLSDLDNAIQNQHCAISLRLEHQNILHITPPSAHEHHLYTTPHTHTQKIVFVLIR